jgi:primosomal protein N' (replication factor Y)
MPSSPAKPLYCDVALPVPIDRAFTYAVGGHWPVVGGRVLVPFRRERLQGVVVAIHSQPPPANPKEVLQTIDREPVLSEEMLDLGRWIAGYYLAPLGEVLRTMLPLGGEVRRQTVYRLTDRGRKRLAELQGFFTAAPTDGADAAVLAYLSENDDVRAKTLRERTSASAAVLSHLVAKRWISRESAAASMRPVIRRNATLVPGIRLSRLNDNQRRLLDALSNTGGQMSLSRIAALSIPRSTVASLVRRGAIRLEEILETPAEAVGNSDEWAGPPSPDEEQLNSAQKSALRNITESVNSRKFSAFLLRGVTGSGKTAVYIAAMRRALEVGLSSLLLVPEIGLTPATTALLRSSFGSDVALLHSALTASERRAEWHRIRRGDAHVVVGTRSAVFAPITNLGLVIVDEEQDGSYKQGELPRYHARDVAVMRAKSADATVVLGSATPSLESWSNAQGGKYALLTIGERVGGRPMPQVTIVDMNREFLETGHEQLISRALTEEIEATLNRGEQAMLLLNRRGYSSVLMCRACGEKLQCENCAIALTYHSPVHGHAPRDSAEDDARPRHLECHYCGFRRKVPRECANCGSEHLYFFGAGSEQGEERLQEIFPRARIARMDRDTMRRRGDYERILARLHRGEINLLVGTQMIAKGHDIHGVTLVGVVGIDHALSLPDFRSAERAFQLLTQAAGRAGRGCLPGRVLVQTHYPDHYAVQFAAGHDYAGFAERELRYRRLLHYPPAAALANVLIEHTDPAKASGWARQIGHWFQGQTFPGVRILGPAASPIARIKRVHRFHLVIKASGRKPLAAAVRGMLEFLDASPIPRKHITVDVDAVQLM